MNLVSWLLALSTLLLLTMKAVTFQRATVCRQEAWLKSTVLKTRSLLSDPSPRERDWHLSCRIHFLRDQETVTWQTLPSLTHHRFDLQLEGNL